ncbi:MAG: AAA family ATPase [Desulfosporosinus sp.]
MNESIFDKVKTVARIEEVVERFGVKLDRSNKALCPFHSEKTPSFSIKREDNIFRCFGCGEGGDAIDFVAKHEGIEPLEAAKKIAAMYGIDTAQNDNKRGAVQASKTMSADTKTLNKVSKQSIKEYITACIGNIDKTDYFTKRGLNKDTITKFGLGFDEKKQCVVIPYSSDYTYYQTRSIDGKEFRKPPTDIAGPEPLWNEKGLMSTGIVFVVESPICAMSIMQCGEVAISTNGTSGINKVTAAIKKKKPKCKVILSMDNDEPGQEAQYTLASVLAEEKMQFMQYNISDDCKDPNELLIKDAKRLKTNIKRAKQEIRKCYATDKDSFGADDLVNERLEPISWVVEDLLPTGLAMLCAPSKFGKSWMVLQLCIAAAEGNSFLNYKTVQCGSLYYALEDGKGRLQDRLKKQLKGSAAPKGVRFAIKADMLDGGLLNKIEEELTAYPDTKLVIIDTLQKVRGKMSKEDTLYGNEYRQMAAVKEFADKHKICLLFVHHLRKMADDSDKFNMISGSTALMGASDTILILSKKKRTDESATLDITGRDIEQSELVVAFDRSKYKWEVEGTVEEIAARREIEEYEANVYIKTIKELVKRNPINGWSGSAQDLMKAVYDVTGKQVVDTTQVIGKLITKFSTRLYYDDIEHKASRTGSARKHTFTKRVSLPPYWQGTIYDKD